MQSARRSRTAVVAFLAIVGNVSIALCAEPAASDWLRGTNEDLEICLKGEVTDADGGPVEFRLRAGFNGDCPSQTTAPEVEGQQFKQWLKVNRFPWEAVWLHAESIDGRRAASIVLKPQELRQATVDGVKLSLQPSTRHVKVKVVERGQPVRGATVKAQLKDGVELQTASDENGIAQIHLSEHQYLWRLITLTDNQRTGGYRFHYSSPYDPYADSYEITLSPCRDLKIRLVYEDGSPAKGIRFKVQLNQPKLRHESFTAIADATVLTTDAAGEAIYPWLATDFAMPYYLEIPYLHESPEYDPKASRDFIVFKMKNRAKRYQVTGRIEVDQQSTTPGGFLVKLTSPQGEREFYEDPISLFTNPDGTFVANVLPDARYARCVDDARWSAEIFDFVPYDSATKLAFAPKLIVSQGQPVKVIATEGPNHDPIASADIAFRRQYEFAYQREGKQQWDCFSLEWKSKTNSAGVAVTQAPPGQLFASLQIPTGTADRPSTTVVSRSSAVVRDKPIKITFHLEAAAERTLTGKLVLDNGAKADLKDAEIQFGPGRRAYSKLVKADADGNFKFEWSLPGILAIARTADHRAFGTFFAKNVDAPLEIRLGPAQNYEGQLLGKDDQPVANEEISAAIKINLPHPGGSSKPLVLEAPLFTAETDQQGNFTLRGLPIDQEICIYGVSIDRKHSLRLGRFKLAANYSLPRQVIRLESIPNPPKEDPLTERVEAALKDCSRTGRRLLFIHAYEGDAVSDFVEKHYLEPAKSKDRYVPFVVMVNWNLIKPADIPFLAGRGWDLPAPGEILAYVLDAEGKRLGSHSTMLMSAEPTEGIAEFIAQHASGAATGDSK